MKASIIIAGILNLVGAFLFTFGGLSAIFLPQMQTVYNNMHPWMGWIVGGVFILGGLAFLCTAVGLFMHKDFARLTTRLLGIFLVVYGVVLGVLGSLSALSTATQAPANLAAVIVILGFATIQVAIGLWWSLCFRRSKMGHLFPTTGIAAHRPDSISAIALMQIGVIFGLPFGAVMKAFPVMGIVLEGWAAQLVLVLWMLITVVMGVGLWRLKEWARTGTLVLFGFGILNSVSAQLFPGAHERYMSIVMAQFGSTKPQAPGVGWITIVACGIFFGIQAYYLITRRAAFRKVG